LMVQCSTVSTNSTCLAVRARWDFWPGRLQRQGTLSIPRPVALESPMAAWWSRFWTFSQGHMKWHMYTYVICKFDTIRYHSMFCWS
jgi:hypothetical protein